MSRPVVDTIVSGPKYAPSTYQTIVLKSNQDFKAVVESETNKKYIIKYDFDLGGETVTLPEGCLIEMDGGTISNGTMVGDHTILIYFQDYEDCIKSVTMQGTWKYNNPRDGIMTENIYDENLDETQKQFNARVNTALEEANRRAQAIIPLPDEEDLTTDGNHNIKLKNKAYAPAQFSGLGKTYLRKNIVEIALPFDGFVEDVTLESEGLTSAPVAIFFDSTNGIFVGVDNLLDPKYYGTWLGGSAYNTEGTLADDDEFKNTSADTYYKYDDGSLVSISTPTTKNILTQEMLSQANTVYNIQYDYDLNGGIMGGVSFNSSNVSSVKTPEKIELDDATADYAENPTAENLERKEKAQVAYEAIGSQDYYYWAEVTLEAKHALFLWGRTIKLSNDKSEIETVYRNIIVAESTTVIYLGCLAGTYNYRYDRYIEIPNNCTLQFEGGSLSHGTIMGHNTEIQSGLSKVFSETASLIGNWNNKNVHVVWFGAAGDNVSDDTAAFKNAVATKCPVCISNKEGTVYLINDIISLENNLYGTNETIRRVTDGEPTTALLRIDHKDNIKVNGIILDGDKVDDIVVNDRAYSHCITIVSSSNIVIEHCVLKNNKGDGIYINADKTEETKIFPEHITIKDCTIEHCTRNNISIINGYFITIADNTIIKSNHFVACIDLEPNWGAWETIKNVSIVNNEFQSLGTATCIWLLHNSYNQDYCERFENITISGNNVKTCSSFLRGAKAAADGLFIENNHVTINIERDSYNTCFDIAYTKDAIIRNNIINNYYRKNQVVALYRNDNIIFESNICNDYTQSHDDYLTFNNNNGISIINNTFNNVQASNGAVYVGAANKDIQILSNKFANVSAGMCIGSNDNHAFMIDNNLIYGTTQANLIIIYSQADGVEIDITDSNKNLQVYPSTGERTYVNILSGAQRLLYPTTRKILSNSRSRVLYTNSTPPTAGYIDRGSICFNLNYSTNNPIFCWIARKSTTDGGTMAWDPILSAFSTKNGTTTPYPTSGTVIGYVVFDRDISRPAWWNGTKWVDANGFKPAINIGTTTEMMALITGNNPTLGPADQGFQFFNKTEGIPCWLKKVDDYTVKWVKADGTDAPTS